jgi:hypothetical protein
MTVILALYVDPMPTPHKLESKDIPTELTSICEYVLDALLKAVKETSAVPSIETKYGKLVLPADPIYRLLMLRSTFGQQESGMKHPCK